MNVSRDPLRPPRVEQRPAQVGRPEAPPQRSAHGVRVSPWSVLVFLVPAVAIPAYLLLPTLEDGWSPDSSSTRSISFSTSHSVTTSASAEPVATSGVPAVPRPNPSSSEGQSSAHPTASQPLQTMCAAAHACCRTVVGAANAASCQTFQNPDFPPFGCETALQSLRQAALAQGRKCPP